MNTSVDIPEPTNDDKEKKDRVWHELPSLFPGGPAIVYFSSVSSEKLNYDLEKARNPNMPDLIKKSIPLHPKDKSLNDSSSDNENSENSSSNINGNNSNNNNKTSIIYYKVHESAVEFAVILNTLKRSGMKKTSTSKWNVMWGKHLPFDEYEKLSKYQKFNHFPGFYIFLTKII